MGAYDMICFRCSHKIYYNRYWQEWQHENMGDGITCRCSIQNLGCMA